MVEANPTNACLMGEHLAGPESIDGVPYFPTGTKSILCKCLTPELYEQLKDTKDAAGYSFKQAIFSGAKYTESGVGVYAGSHDSYKTFAPFFDKVIFEYHGHKTTDKHIVCMDSTKLNCPDFPEDEAAMIKSVRIRVARNLADYPLGTAITPEQRKEVEQKVVSVLESFDGELKGKYYSLATMSEDDRKQLVADHFLFKNGDKYL